MTKYALDVPGPGTYDLKGPKVIKVMKQIKNGFGSGP